ncbi:NADH:flavin oxidoreductase/NADH oxidase [Arthrobacter sp. H5]|uniref:NADH:flavin oxidoreductase/NADH oxidase n=1 Tax=Arthrobacter sp. H5 TaxID=1267973 RepID=UPI000486FC75|nr:NADH:flavin oxidoreductase/NADH oxidase [Arthrobacter sp. H5]
MVTAPGLFDPITLRGLEVSHRGWVAAMCQYSADDGHTPGVPTDWHLMHLGQFAAGGAALIVTEATAVSRQGMISPRDTGLYTTEQARTWRRITDFVHSHGAVDTKIGVQLAHAGRKASCYWPFSGKRGSVPFQDGGWQTVGPTDEAFGSYAQPRPMTEPDILSVIEDFRRSAGLALEAGFDTIEIHAAHRYLLHQFQSPLVNNRTDRWGGDEEGGRRLTLEVIDAVRGIIPDSMPLLLRISASDWSDGGLDGHSSARLAAQAAARGVDLVDVSSGGAIPNAAIPAEQGYQVHLAAEVRSGGGVPTGAVGLINDAGHADHVIRSGSADAVLIARAALRDPHWWQRAAAELGLELPWAPQYERAGGF